MASRSSFKPASYLASAAAAQSPKPSRSPRPSFTRSSSSSSQLSTTSEDSFIATLKSLTAVDQEGRTKGKENSAGSISPRCGTPGVGMTTANSRSFIEVETPGRKTSAPIAIELPGRNPTAVYTPLSARGDLPGGYFPNHEDTKPSYKSHPFSSHHEHKPSSTPSSASSMSATSPTLGSPISETTPRGPTSVLTPGVFQTAIPETLLIPMGKYHPANYKSPSTTSVTTPTSAPSSSLTTRPLPPTNLAIPASTGKRNRDGRPHHQRNESDVKRKLQQYQRDMIAQARLASDSKVAASKGTPEPISPRLLPAGSPGPITPFELEESAGYMVAGARNGESLIGGGLERERERDMVESMIRREGERRQSPMASPATRV